MITTCDANILNDVTKSFNIILKEFINNEAGIFHLALRLDRAKRLRFLDFLMTVEMMVFTRLLADEGTMKFLNDCMEPINGVTMKWLAKDAGGIEVLKIAESDKVTDKDDVEHRMVFKIIEFLQRVYDHGSCTPAFSVSQVNIFMNQS